MLRWIPLLLLCVLLGTGCEKKADPVTSVGQFFDLIAAGHADTAWHNAAFGFQAQRNAAAFAVAAKEMGLTDYISGQWEAPEIEGQTAKVSGEIQTRSGKKLPLIMTLTDENGAWRVYSMRQPPNAQTGISENRLTLIGKAPSFTDAATQPIPPEEDLRQMVRENLLHFNEAIVTKSFDAFYDSVALKWQDQLTKGQLQRAFQPFIDKQVDLSGVKDAEPVWDAPVVIGSEGLLHLSGYFPTEPYRVYFSLRFLYELPNWKLFGVDVNLRK